MAITWAPSADKHGIDHEDALHAIMNAHYVEHEFDDPGRRRTCGRRCSSDRHDSWAEIYWR